MKNLSLIVSNASTLIKRFSLVNSKIKDIINLGSGELEFSTPMPIIRASIKALNNNLTRYPPTKGIPELLKLIEQKLKDFNDIHCKWNENIIITNGASHAISITFAILFNPGEELIISSPNFLFYYRCTQIYNINVIEVQRNIDFSLNIENIKKAIGKKTKAILINSPNNPTGYVLSKKEILELAEIVKNFDLFLITDEVYEKYLYEGIKHISLASLKDIFNRTITIYSMSKSYFATGVRSGYIVASKEIIDLMEFYLQYTVLNVNTIAQYGFIEALKMNKTYFDKILEDFNKKRLFVYKRLKEMDLEVIKPIGAFYYFPSIRKYNILAVEFQNKLFKEKGVLITPGNIFGSYSQYRIRISYAIGIERLKVAMERLEKFVSK